MADDAERRRLFSYLEDRFGIPEEIFASFDLFSRSKSWWLLHRPVILPLPSRLKVSQVGLKAFDQVGKYLKPTTRMVQIFGHHATKGVYRLSEEGFKSLLRGELMKVGTEMEEGYVILSLGEKILGLGLMFSGTLSSRIRQSEANRMITE